MNDIYSDNGGFEMLPQFPKLQRNASESIVEMYAEALMNRADKALLSGAVSQSQYDAWVKRLNKWARA